MGRIRIESLGKTFELELSQSTTIGRHWSCTATVPATNVPLYWLELRWNLNGWAWRCLGGESNTTGRGKLGKNGWRHWSENQSDSPSVSLKPDTRIQLIDSGPPDIFLREIGEDIEILGSDLLDYVEITTDGIVPLPSLEQSEDEPRNELSDGDLVKVNARTFIVHLPKAVRATKEPTLDLLNSAVHLTIFRAQLRAVFSLDNTEVVIEGAPVRVLLSYANALADGPWTDSSGFLSTDEAFKIWVDCGGSPGSTAERIGWDRGKLRSMLVQEGVTGADKLFLRKRTLRQWHHKINISPANISFQ